MSHPDGVLDDLEALVGRDELLLGAMKCDETEDGHYYLTLRVWPHRTRDDCVVYAFRYGYLTKIESGSDGWVDGGGNMRAYDPAAFLRELSQLIASAIPRLDGGSEPVLADVTEE